MIATRFHEGMTMNKEAFMRARVTVVAMMVAALATASAAKDVYLSIAGSVGVFRTDTRIFNPSGTKDITITGTFLPTGQDNSAAPTRTITVGSRKMVVLNDVVSTLFNASGLGAIGLSSPDDFIAMSRIYATTPGGTLGQFVPGLEVSAAKTKGVLIGLKATGTTAGTYRTNTGFVNPNATATTVTLRTYDTNNAIVRGPVVHSIPPFSVLFPVSLDALSGNLTDSWMSCEATQPIFGFASVIDNGTTDPTFITASEDTGVTPPQPGITKLYLWIPSIDDVIGGLRDFRLSPQPRAVTDPVINQLCLSSMSWSATLTEDMVGTSYRFKLGVVTPQSFDPLAPTTGTMVAEIVHRRGSTDTILASTTLMTTRTSALKDVSMTGPDPDARAGDTLLLRTRITAGLPCIEDGPGPGTTHFIEVPRTSVSP